MRVEGKRRGKLPERSVCHYESVDVQTRAAMLVIQATEIYFVGEYNSIRSLTFRISDVLSAFAPSFCQTRRLHGCPVRKPLHGSRERGGRCTGNTALRSSEHT